MNQDLTKGPVMRSMLRFAVPMLLGNLLQQCYNITDTWIVGNFLGANALAAVGSSFTLMTFLTSILLGLCMGSGAVFSIRFGQRDENGLKEDVCASFVLIAGLTVVLNVLAFACLDIIRIFLWVPGEVWGVMREYLAVIFCGIAATFLYNYFASFLRAIGNSLVPLIFLGISAGLNIVLDLWFVLGLERGVAGAAEATVISQYVSRIGITIYALARCPQLRIQRSHCRIRLSCIREIAGFSVLTCIQQSVMNLGILMVQGLVNSFGAAVMAALLFCAVVSTLIWIFARPLMTLFVDGNETEIIAEGVRYLHIEGTFYCGIGCLFLLYGLYRALGKPGMSVILTIISLGTRVVLAYVLSAVPAFGVAGIWWSVPIGWVLADTVGGVYYLLFSNQNLHF